MNEMIEGFSPCPCCGTLTMSEVGVYEICSVCFWEDDPVQTSDPTYAGGANQQSLVQARANWDCTRKGPNGSGNKPFTRHP